MTCPWMSTIFSVVGIVVSYLLYIFFQDRSAKKKLERWNHTSKDLVILHGFPPTANIPSPSPYVLKVQTFLHMANLRYTMDTKDPMGDKGKAPWISVNGQHIADSEFIIQFLNKKFEKNLNANISPEKLAVAQAMRIMLEEHFILGFAVERWVHGSVSELKKLLDAPFLILTYFKFMMKRRMKSQGITLHSRDEIIALMKKDLRIVSTVLGKNKFICGDEPCEYDAGIFSMLAQIIWASSADSPYLAMLNGELTNLKAYCIRMKDKYWQDWDLSLKK